MKKFLLVAVAAVSLVPAIGYAATYADVSLGSSAILSVGGITLDVTSATMQEIDVNSGNFVATLAPGSSITVTAPNLNELSVSPSQNITSQQCNSSGSNLTLTVSASQATTTLTVTPSSTLCGAVSNSPATNGPVASGGGGGGGGGSGATVPTTTTTGSTQTGGSTLGALQMQLNALLAQIAALTGKGTPNANAYLNANANASFKRSLSLGTKGADVQALQVYLNAHGYVIAASGPGSSGNETTLFGRATKAALMKLQKAAGITPVNGLLGPKTRAYITAHP